MTRDTATLQQKKSWSIKRTMISARQCKVLSWRASSSKHYQYTRDCGKRMSCPKCEELSSQEDMTPWIDRAVGWIEGLGYTVIQQDHGLGVAGRVTHDIREVRTNNCCAVCEVIVLAHEAGHILHILDEGDLTKRRSYREECALSYGWQFLNELGAPISIGMWLDDHEDRP